MKNLRAALAVFALCLTRVASFAIIDPALQAQLGNPTGATADTSNHAHYLIQRAQYELDYNDTTHEANWVAWDYTSADSGGAGRSPVFFQDTTLPAGFYQVLTTDYSGSGYDRGHMSPSADRTATRADNDATFYMSNMVPQTPDNNQGVWASFENYTRSLAAAGNEILITSGPSGFGGSTIASGVAIPGYTWKFALVVPLGPGTALSRINASTRIIAIKIPNIAGVRSTPWENFVTSVAQLEADTGYTFLTALDPGVRAALRVVVDGQTATGAPGIVAQPTAQTAPVGATATFTVVASGDAPLTYQWLKDDNEIAGATDSTLTLTNVQAGDVATYTVAVSNNVGSITSNGADLIVSGLPPTIAEQPTSRTAAAGSTVSFTVTAGGSAPFTYQWRKGGVNLADGGSVSGSSTPTLTLANVQGADVAGYDVVVTNNVSSITSAVATLAVTPAAPTITSQPANRSLAPGSTATFTVVAVGTAPLSYQWRKNLAPISGNASAATATLTLTGISLADAGNYDVVVTNGVGAATSAAASLAISSASPTQVFYTGGTYVQDFDTLPPSGTFTNNVAGSATAVLPLASAPFNATGAGGWTFAQTATSGTERFTVGTGSSNTGSAYSFGATAATDRALGVLSSSSNISVFGVTIVNNTGQTVTSLNLGYTGEQWRYAANAGGSDRLSVEYQIGGTDIVSGTFTAIPALDFNSPVNNANAASFGVLAAGALNGNDPNFRSALAATLTGITWAPGQTIVIRWKQLHTSTADGLAADAFSFSTPITGPVGPSVASTVPASAATNVALNAGIAITFDQAVSASGSWFALNSATRGALSAAVTVSPDGRTYTLTPPSNFDFSESIAVSVFASGITSQSTGLHPAANYSFSFVTAPPVPPAIITPPVAQTVAAGSNASFTVAASGTAPFSYQWRKNGVAIAGNPTASSATLVLTNVQAADIASYDVVVGNGVGSPVTSTAAALSVTPTAPTIVTQPVAQVVAAGDSVTLTVSAKGTTPLSYQWRRNSVALSDGGAIAGANSPTLTLTGVTVANAGTYDVVVTNGVNPAATSSAVTVLVTVPPSMINYSGGTYAQNFDTLPSAGTFSFTGIGPFSLDANPGVNAAGLAGWSFVKFAGSGANALFKFDNGGSNAGSAISYGTTGATDRALGSLASGSASSRVGVTFVNTTGQTVDYVTLSYTGEQWRHGGATTPNKFAFSYAVGVTDINTGTFTNATALDFTAPVVTTTTGALDGNAAANRVTGITATLTGLNWAPGQTLVLRWTDVDDAGSDDGLAIDDFTFTIAPPVPTITTQPVSQTVAAFSPVSFTVAADSTTAQTYQWRKGGTNILGNPSATTATLALAGVTIADAGSYDCVVTNSFGSTTSDAATLAVTPIHADVTLANLTATYDGSSHAATATTAPAGLSVVITYDGAAAVPINAGSYAVVATIADANYAGAASDTLVISPAAATVTLAGLSQTYSGAPRVVTATTTPAGVSVGITYDGGATAPTNAGVYAIDATVTDPNYTGGASGILVVAKAVAPIALNGLSQVYDGTPRIVTATTTPAGLPVAITYDGSTAAPTNAGSYAIAATISNTNYTGSATGTLTVSPGSTTITLGGLSQTYDGTPKSATAVTTPAGLNVDFTYNGSATAPTAPGSYAVVGTIDDPNYSGSATGTLVISTAVLVRHAPTLNAGLDGSLQLLLPESTTLNGSAWVSGDLLVPGTPTVQLNGHPTYGGTVDGTGLAMPTNFTITLNGNALIRHVVRRTPAVAMPVVAAPPSPTGTRSVSLNSASDSPGDFATIRNLTLNGNAGTRTVPAGTYGTLTVNGNSGLILGVAGATTPSVYNLQGLTLNGNSTLRIAGPVVINLASGVSVNGSLGDSGHPEWLAINVASGGFTLNGNVTVSGSVTAPNGTVTINGNSKLNGNVAADRLTINGNGLIDTLP